MSIAFTVIHILACGVLVLVVLLQQGKGADMGAVFGGSSATIFGSSGAGNFLTRLTTAAAVIYMCTSLGLSFLASERLSASVFDSSLPEPPPIQAPGAPLVPGAPESGGQSAAPPAAPAPEAQAPAVLPQANPPAAAPQAPAAEPQAKADEAPAMNAPAAAPPAQNAGQAPPPAPAAN